MKPEQANLIGDRFRTYCTENGIPTPTVQVAGEKYTYHFGCELSQEQIGKIIDLIRTRTNEEQRADVAFTHGHNKTRIEVATYGIEGPTP